MLVLDLSLFTQAVFLNVLFKSLKSDPVINRVKVCYSHGSDITASVTMSSETNAVSTLGISEKNLTSVCLSCTSICVWMLVSDF